MKLSDRISLAGLLMYAAFFVSGVAGLIYEVVWSKYLALFIGGTGLAQIIVLATFMGGLAWGSRVFGRYADRTDNPLRLYALLEIGMGVYALLFDHIFLFARAVFIRGVAMGSVGGPGMTFLKIVSCVICILLPTFLMGGTMPAMGRHMIRQLDSVGWKISRLYFLNSLGAVFGCLWAGFFLISRYGLQWTMVTGALLNLASGFLAWWVSRRAGDFTETLAVAPVEVPSTDTGNGGWRVRLVLTCVAFSGAVSMMYEVAWIRLLTLVLGSSTYAFSLMLATFILGLSLGGWLLSLKKRPQGYTAIFGLSEVCVGLTVLISLPFYIRLPYLFNQVFSSLSREVESFGLYQFSQFLFCAMVMIVPTILQGITLPAATQVLVRDLKRFGGRVGFIFAVNTVGTLAGVLFAGFVGLPRLGIKGTLELAVVINGVLGLGVLYTQFPGRGRRGTLTAGILASVLVWGGYALTMGEWDRNVLSSGVYRLRERIPSHAELQRLVHGRKTIFYRDGVDATIAVQDLPEEDGQRILVINGKVDASTGDDLPTQKMVSHLPLLLRPGAEDVLVVGVGSGASIGAVLAYDVKRVDVVEISRDVMEAARLFETINGAYWKDPRVTEYAEDAKTFLQVGDARYDLIVSEPTNPWIAGVAGVFSREYFEACARRLKAGGLFVQWVQAYEIEDATFYMILETFSGVFPCYTLWNSTLSDTILIGSMEPYRPDFRAMREAFTRPAVNAEMESLGIRSLLPILSMQMTDRAGTFSHVPWTGDIHSDFFPILEYVAPRGFFLGSTAGGVKLLDERGVSPANASLWLTDYWNNYFVGPEEFDNAYLLAVKYSGLCDKLPLMLAQEWRSRYPEDHLAEAAFLRSADRRWSDALAHFKKTPKTGYWDKFNLKKACAMAYADYTATRSCAGLPDQPELAYFLEVFYRTYPGQTDGDTLLWRGELRYDAGDYRAAAEALRGACEIWCQAGNRPHALTQAVTLLCRSLIRLSRATEAATARRDFLPASGYEMEGRFLDGLITLALRPSAP